MSDISPFAKMRLETIQTLVGAQLDAISKILPAGYKLTFIARHPDIEDAQIVMTEDDNVEQVIKELRNAKAL